jgi:predicted ATPase
VVSNDVNADGASLIMITGANQGGKSTFLRSVGLAQLMMQCLRAERHDDGRRTFRMTEGAPLPATARTYSDAYSPPT